MSGPAWMDDFAGFLREQEDQSERTVAAYAGAIRIFAAWFAAAYGRPFAPAQLAARDVRAYRHELQEVRGLAAATINVALAALRALARWAMASGALTSNPAAATAFVEPPEAQPRWMQRGELSRLLAEYERAINDAAARGATERERQATRDLAAVALMAGAGLRVSEACGLELSDVQLGERAGQALVRHGKGRRQRTVPLSAELRRTLAAWLALRGDAPGPLLLSQRGGRLAPRQLQRSVAEHARRARLDGFTPHSLRHTFVKRVVEASDLSTAQQLAGHEQIRTTARYAMPSQAELAAAAEGALL
ncbi:MAG: tyrosine-type recombinase/integrase [Anaerolineales bacterium]|nr:tyrosine-type recombinase/integrase [Anaerolineales bacterium]